LFFYVGSEPVTVSSKTRAPIWLSLMTARPVVFHLAAVGKRPTRSDFEIVIDTELLGTEEANVRDDAVNAGQCEDVVNPLINAQW